MAKKTEGIGAPSTDELIKAGSITEELQQAQIADLLNATEAEMRSKFPRLAAAIDAWRTRHGDAKVAAVRITAKRDGFRRAGMSHTAAPTDHPADRFADPALIEQLLDEPNLVVEFLTEIRA